MGIHGARSGDGGISYFLYEDIFSWHARRWEDSARGVALFTGMVASQYIGFAVPALIDDQRTNMRAYGISWLLGPPPRS